MARDARGAVVSVRISEEEQARLRLIADERGTSVSDLVRSAALREAGGERSSAGPGVTVSTSPTSSVSQIEHGLFWDAPQNANISGGTLELNN